MKSEKKLSLKNVLGMVTAVAIVVMMFIPFSALALEIILGVETAFAVSILIYSFIKHHKAMPKLVLFFALFSLIVNIGFTRAALTGYANGSQILVVEYFANVICGNNYIIGFIVALILMVVQILVIYKGVGRIAEVAARFSLDTMNQKFFEIDKNLGEKKISEDEAEKQRKDIQNEIEFYSGMEVAAKFLNGTTKASIIICLVNLIGGLLMEMVMTGETFSDSLGTVTRISSGNIIIFFLPLLIVSFALGMGISNRLEY